MKADTVTKDYVKDAGVFADVFNFYVYGGEQVILPESLTERDPTEIAFPYGADGASVPIQRFRDAQKLYAAMTDGEIEYVLCGVESQTESHYAMPVKNNLYDAIDYVRQVEEAAKSRRNARKQGKGGGERADGKKRPNSGEFLGGFWKEDRLIPSVTVTIYFGSDEWDAPMSLFEMMEVKDNRVLSCMDDYHVRLIAPALLPDGEIMKFRSSLREVLLFIKHSKSKDELREVLEKNQERFREMERRAVDVISTVTNMGLSYNREEMRIDVCQAIQDLRLESEKIGEGRGELRKAQEIARNFFRLGVDVDKVAEGVGYDLKTVKKWLGLPV